MPTYVRHLDQELVEAVQVTSDTLDDVRVLVAGYVTGSTDAGRISLTRQHPYGVVEVVAGDWLVRDDERIYAVRSYEFSSLPGGGGGVKAR